VVRLNRGRDTGSMDLHRLFHSRTVFAPAASEVTMVPQKSIVGVTVAALAVMLFVWVARHRLTGARSVAMPDGATAVNFGKSGGWVHCWLDQSIQLNRCQIFNGRGERLYPLGGDRSDDVFLPYDRSGPVVESDLVIDQTHTSPTQVWLESGMVLVPRSDFEFQRASVERLKSR
jgi:hypothetical protein